MKLTSSLIFLTVLVASAFCEDTTTTTTTATSTVTIPPDTTESSTQTTTVPSTTSVSTTSQQPDTTTVPTSTTTEPTTTSSTLAPTTTPPTTTSPSTTTPASTTTTPKPTTTSPPDTTTTVTTSTPQPTTVPPSTTVSPEPTPVDGSWNVTDGNLTCIRADLRVRFSIVIKDQVKNIVLSPNAASSGNCKLSDNTQEIQLEESEFVLTMVFEKDSNNAYLKNVTFVYALPEGSGNVYNDTKLFSVKIGNSYMCDSMTSIDLKNVTMEVFRIHIQSFGSVGDKNFGTAEECAADNKVNDMVPIAVGIALLVLVVVVLVAYFVGRRRSRQRGYQSV